MKKWAGSILFSALLFGIFASSSFAAAPGFMGNPELTGAKMIIYEQKTSFFDEADALFGKRSNVRDSHDKYANQEVSR